MKAIKITKRVPWTKSDNRALIRLYNKLLKLELAGQPYQKAPHVREIAAKQGRSKGSVEMKMCNLSAARVALGLPYIKGWKPLGNAQLLLKNMIAEDANKDQQ